MYELNSGGTEAQMRERVELLIESPAEAHRLHGRTRGPLPKDRPQCGVCMETFIVC